MTRSRERERENSLEVDSIFEEESSVIDRHKICAVVKINKSLECPVNGLTLKYTVDAYWKWKSSLLLKIYR